MLCHSKDVKNATGITLFNNYHSLITKLPDLLLLIKYIIKGYLLQKQCSWREMRNNSMEYKLPNKFYTRIAKLSSGITLSNYINIT